MIRPMTETRDPAKWVKRTDAPAVAEVSQRKIDTMLSDGRLTKYKDGFGRIWIDREELVKLKTLRTPQTSVR